METSIKKKNLLIIHIISLFFILITGSLFHFFYEWSGNNPVVGLFCAVNESVWEHLKLGFWPFILFSMVDFWFLKNKVNNYFIAKAVGILSMQVFIVFFFYSYTALLKHHNLFLDISSFIIGGLLCHIISFRLMIRKELKKLFGYIGISALIISALCLMVFTYFPPRLPIFKDSQSHGYGINHLFNSTSSDGEH
ncbi:MAG: hypothetical protein JXJ04_23425 [Spirochaetales bacterium]|nr:hypothetical protein [Spirochaetales bacterium]